MLLSNPRPSGPEGKRLYRQNANRPVDEHPNESVNQLFSKLEYIEQCPTDE